MSLALKRMARPLRVPSKDILLVSDHELGRDDLVAFGDAGPDDAGSIGGESSRSKRRLLHGAQARCRSPRRHQRIPAPGRMAETRSSGPIWIRFTNGRPRAVRPGYRELVHLEQVHLASVGEDQEGRHGSRPQRAVRQSPRPWCRCQLPRDRRAAEPGTHPARMRLT